MVHTTTLDLNETPFFSTHLPNKWRLRLTTLYAEPHRYYHTSRHIATMLKLFHETKQFLRNLKAVELAILFHDAIYDPKSTTSCENEENSIALFHEFVKDMKGTNFAVSTQDSDTHQYSTHPIPGIQHLPKHVLDAPTPDPSMSDIAFFLDYDLAILAAERSEYQEYMRAIRKEYEHYSEDAYREGRKKVLETFLARERLYLSAFAEQRGLEGKARGNLRWEIEILEKGDPIG
ncbi:hypothetical protein BJ508DRAFT_216143 [Ascobolus immersus RN42]|uniref:HD domain-containing protein n=1 Tax=Ascobolus immersus RN42 TaxID=1160509 RepID=A0A3N4HHB1_ASCIM|nr:hypothetical protein BJ508DRAFT_216143 [Ascobolus immersus RN42]